MLTQRQLDALVFICDFMDKNGISPTFREIQSALGMGSVQNAFSVVEALEKRGFVAKHKYTQRGVEILRRPDAVDAITQYGKVKSDIYMARRYVEFLEDSDRDQWQNDDWVALASIRGKIDLLLERERQNRDGNP